MSSTDSIIAQDYLDKEGKYAKSWKKRWFVLYSDRLEYFQDESKGERKGAVGFVSQSIVSEVSVLTISQFMKKITKYSFSIFGVEEDGPFSSSSSSPSSSSPVQEMEISSEDENKIRIWQRLLSDTIESFCKTLPSPEESLPSNSQGNTKLSNNARIQRFVVSKMAGSSVGQEVLTKVIGQDFQDVIDCLCSGLTKYANPSLSSELKEHILKLTTKIAVLSNDGVISPQQMSSISQSLRQLFRLITRSMFRPPSLSMSVHSVDTSFTNLEDNLVEINSLLRAFHDTTLPIISSHMSPANSNRLTALCDFFQSTDFMRKLLSEDEYGDERVTLKSYAKYLPNEKMKQTYAQQHHHPLPPPPP